MSASRRNILPRPVIIIGVVLLIALVSLQLWFSYNASGFLENIVSQRSHGKLKLKVKGLRFNIFSNYVEVKQGTLVTGNALSSPATYNIKLSKLSLHVSSFWPLLFQRALMLDSVKIYDPIVDVNRWREDTASIFNKSDFSLPNELGRMYNSLLDGLEAFGIKKIVVERGRFRFNNKMDPDSRPVVLSNIYFNLVRLADGSIQRDAYIQDKQSVELRTYNQDIVLPGGRHRLSFSNFRLELFQKRIELDSCTLTAQSTGASKSSFNIFFNKLLLVGVDFNAMYRNNLIRADSVYCIEPMIHLVFNRSDSSQAQVVQTKSKPDPEKILRDLTGDLDLAFVGVKDAGIRVDIHGLKSRSLYNSRKDDFAMHHLRISPDSSIPVKVDQFDLLVRDYRLYNQDSSTAIGFDSVHFSNNKIVLSNFSVVTTPSRFGPSNFRNFKIPHFELVGLDWYELIFEENLFANEATLYNPIINYKGAPRNPSRKKANLFQILRSTDALLTLDRINVVNGQLNVQLASGTSIHLQNAELGLHSNKLLASKNNEGVKSAIDNLSFKTGIIHLKNLTARLDNVQYTGNKLATAQSLIINNKDKSVYATAQNVRMNNLLLDESAQSVIVDGLQWQSASINLSNAGTIENDSHGKTNVSFHNISGHNTQIQLSNKSANLSTYLQSISAASFALAGNHPPKIEGLVINGDQLSFANGPMTIKAGDFYIADGVQSYISDLKLDKFENRDSFKVRLPKAAFLLNVNSVLHNNIQLDKIQLQSPDISMSKWQPIKPKEHTGNIRLHIGALTATSPSIKIVVHRNDSSSFINLPRSKDGRILINKLTMNQDGTTIGKLSLESEAATFTKTNGETLGVEKGNINVELSDIHLSNGGAKPSWNTLLTRLYLSNPNSFTTRSGGRFSFEKASVGNFQLSSETITDFNKLARLNFTAWVRTTTGQYVDSNTTIKWFNAGYNADEKVMTLDSFVYLPTLSRDSLIAATPYQTDYKTLHTGPVQFTGFDLERYNKDSIFIANTITIYRPLISVYRDKRHPFLGGQVKPLPAETMKQIKLPISIGKINLINGLLTYTELNRKTRKEGTIALTNLDASLGNITNRNLQLGDSLSLSLDAMLLDSAQLRLRVKESYTDSLNGFLMTLRMRPASSLTFLNPVLVPLSNIKITSGVIDSLHLRAIGSEYVSLGEMNMFYHDLKIRLMKGGDETRSTFIRKILSGLANTFVIKKDNNGQSSIVYFERRRDRSFFNYIVKMTFSGMASSVGIKNNKKYMRRYQKVLQEGNLPPIRFEDALEKTLESKNGGQDKGIKLGFKNSKNEKNDRIERNEKSEKEKNRLLQP
ncbi:hypothetical protein OCK74_02645 [Chitinophagaceae bacterium LB-8]|uniref:Uncharacterized protein n=1 Tax=Paraflavisolibacter caeni TaxID=2982496 RepID=A0A9X2XSD3_9BACT|nr:hypothetical protein [Paraflavisolibacter caeni]MCU7547991.1 hypothetical protein [Paraflavisolibacter caeni]